MMVEKGKLYYETKCEHGEMAAHFVVNKGQFIRPNPECPGGTRTEVTIDYGDLTPQKIREAVAYLKATTMPAEDSTAVWADETVMDAASKFADIVDAALVEGGNQHES